MKSHLFVSCALIPLAVFACSGGDGNPSGQTQGAENGGPANGGSGGGLSPSSGGGSGAGDAAACTGALPQICEVCSNGTTECAHWVDVNGQCAVEICAPGETPTPTPTPGGGGSGDGGAGGSAGDAGSPPPVDAGTCNCGAVPQICEICSDGTEACAHCAEINGQCTVQICP